MTAAELPDVDGPPVELPAAAPEVVQGEIITDAEYQRATAATSTTSRVQRARQTWTVVRSDASARRAVGREVVGRVLRAPGRAATAEGRGLAVLARAWWRWVCVDDWYQAAKGADKLSDRWADIHRHAVWRRVATLVGLVVGTVAVLVAEHVVDTRTKVVAVLVVAAAVAVVGRRKDGAPGRSSLLPTGRGPLAWAMDGDNLVRAYREAKVVGKDEGLQFVVRPHRDGDGWAVTVDLPGTRKASDAVRAREALASALGVDEVQLLLERVRGKGGHAGRLDTWVADEDPYDRAPTRSPLEDAPVWDLWRSVPFGTTARGRRVNLPLLWTNVLVGALPRVGKTIACRIPATAAALDPHARLIVVDGKGGKDWSPFELVAHRFLRGDDDETVERLVAVLAEIVADVKHRYAVIATMDDEECPESKITPGISTSKRRNMPLSVLFVDEFQVYSEHEKYGEQIVDALVYLVKKAPAAGYIVVLATQKPDADAVPPRLRDVIGTRFALRVKTWQSSEAILGTGTSKAGTNATTFLPSHKGVGFLLGADGETELESGEATIVRTDKLEISAVRAACERGRAARADAGTLTGDALDWRPDRQAPTGPVRATAERADRTTTERPAVEGAEQLAQLAAYLVDDDRDKVPTAELVAEALGGDDQDPAAVRALGTLLRTWGVSTDRFRSGGAQVRGPRVDDVRQAAARHLVPAVTAPGTGAVTGSVTAPTGTPAVTPAGSSDDAAA